MSPSEIVEFALRTAELASEIGDIGIAREMLSVAANLLRPYGSSRTRTRPAVMVTTDYKQAPCS